MNKLRPQRPKKLQRLVFSLAPERLFATAKPPSSSVTTAAFESTCGASQGRRNISGGSEIYELRSAMHIPLVALGITPNSIKLVRHLSKTLGQFNYSEIEFFSDYTSFLDKTRLARDPIEELHDEDEMAESRLITIDTVLRHATGLSPETHLVEHWSHFFAHKSQKQVTQIEPDRKLVHAIGIEDRTM